MPLTLLTAGAHIRRNKRLLLASGLCLSAHAALLLFGLRPTQTQAVTLDSLSASPALMLNLAAMGTHSSTNSNTAPAANTVSNVKSIPQKSEPQQAVEPSTAPAKAVKTPKQEQLKPVAKKTAPKTAEHKPQHKKEKKKTEKNREKKAEKKTVAAPRNPESERSVADNPDTRIQRTDQKTAAISATSTNASADNSSTVSATTASSTAQASSSHEPRFRVPPSPPEYPKASRMRRQEGTVLLEVKLGTQGEQLQVVLVKSSGFPLLDRSALKAVKGWQFLPQEINGTSISHVVRIPVRFELT